VSPTPTRPPGEPHDLDQRKKEPRGQSETHADYGLFGPDSVTWRVWGYPTSLTVAFSRAVVVEELDPFLVAAVDATSKI
jgi:uncharacterized protein (DUF2236 family)